MFHAKDVLSSSIINHSLPTLWSAISPLYMVDEAKWLKELIPLAQPSEREAIMMTDQAAQLIQRVRDDKQAVQMIDALLLEYSLDTKEGILLMCLAEALMRIPDAETADALIRDKLSAADWKSHLKNSDSTFVNASTWGLLLTGKVVSMDVKADGSPSNAISRLVNKFSEPVIRQAMNQAMKIMGHQFVLGRTIEEAQKKGKAMREKGYTYSFDMLGEAALTQSDAHKYFKDYIMAIESVGRAASIAGSPDPTVSIKLSALHPRYEVANKVRVMGEMCDTVLKLLERARELDVGITIDAEEMDRLELSLLLFEKLYRSDIVKGWGKFGIVVQAYSKRALPVLVWLTALAKEQGDMIPLRLVKGAYWDTELKISQQFGFARYPVFTRKEATDVSYLACARYLLSDHVKGNIFPQFASHNAHTVAAITSMATHDEFEFQRLHGMGDALYDHAMEMFNRNVRIYAPVGSHKDLLPYLVRRLLENGANSSFVHRLVDANCPIESLTEHPVDTLLACPSLDNQLIPLPPQIFSDRKNSYSINLDVESEAQPFEALIQAQMTTYWQGGPIVNNTRDYESMIKEHGSALHVISSPYDRTNDVGSLVWSSQEQVSNALDIAHDYFPIWQQTPVTERADYLEALADKLEANMPELVALCHKEAGKTIHDSIDEVREAVDFCRYYAVQAKLNFTTPETIVGFDDVSHQIARQGRGVFVCISPWNFPLAIFLGQVTAALVAGNTVIAKPAEQTSLIAVRAMELLLETGIAPQAVHLLPGDGKTVGAPLTSDHRVAGVAFTGSTETAQLINRTLANRTVKDVGVAPVPFIAETGGQNAMIVDSTALPEQVVRDVMRSAFASAGQRCSALRVLFVQQDIADRIINLIKGAMAELKVGLPELHCTDVGPVIDLKAKEKLLAHIEKMTLEAHLVAQAELPDWSDNGDFVPPSAFEIESISQLENEQFGPILHIVRFKANEIDKVVSEINSTGFGLTMGIHSRNEVTYTRIEKNIKVGNCYINRDQVGAVVGVQPFGGQGLSGTGPKAGGPRYLFRYTQAQQISSTATDSK
ncbi:bifunctional proline dehydrogenase/L-glutamate gamma-semialdehyde dehydrogenase PutA [Aliivibrio sp. S4TY2]|uniref:bifunctional proline dehydrogenase/L-glutamate gamma-semialdehyde dehydrogenase PutA n=1 Tax=unclassified Aliivibrio TaxID=2645654 RepID=UPI002378E92C|nr:MULTISPECIES: bifunctional proline dehydrogenase/L-glutamate gamma-semialdehyde dehydrogenase PutA [unclassified Aliivibrio]MDD9156240.1 bifunctional proline dehydrogenase/L-glutamate gamma-semialdehyde dehydrogenase PutA [Aliivibrio sp. S4TY2]MDD9160587.1 bifunctional proline dehydrogenase/L-glutamate gamma-semialdehyde dehydrogenase PutA [Aliivibrio sp. S4TY1]MDD9163948.1 bifunctional proline dehydrogenase/L-glutamate gamma-semialdehyde dehydrogenase PutA [Aliivibrio sp. S4MY2]MDD9168077.1